MWTSLPPPPTTSSSSLADVQIWLFAKYVFALKTTETCFLSHGTHQGIVLWHADHQSPCLVKWNRCCAVTYVSQTSRPGGGNSRHWLDGVWRAACFSSVFASVKKEVGVCVHSKPCCWILVTVSCHVKWLKNRNQKWKAAQSLDFLF